MGIVILDIKLLVPRLKVYENAFLHRFRVLKMRQEDRLQKKVREDKCGLWMFNNFLGVLYRKNDIHFFDFGSTFVKL